MLQSSSKVTIALLLLLQPAYSSPGEEEEYLYLGPNRIVELPSLAEVPCQQDFPLTNQIWGIAAVVPYGGADSLMLCDSMVHCYVWRNSGWELSDTLSPR